MINLTDDALEALLTILFEPLKHCDDGKKIGDANDLVPTNFKKSVYAYFSLMLTNKQFNRVMRERKMDCNWYQCVTHIFPRDKRLLLNLNYLEKPEDVETKRMLKTLVYLDSYEPILRAQVDNFMGKHNLVYRTRATNKIYKGYVSVRKLATMKIKTKELATQFKSITMKHRKTHTKRLLLIKALVAHSRKIEDAKPRVPIPNMWAFLVK